MGFEHFADESRVWDKRMEKGTEFQISKKERRKISPSASVFSSTVIDRWHARQWQCRTDSRCEGWEDRLRSLICQSPLTVDSSCSMHRPHALFTTQVLGWYTKYQLLWWVIIINGHGGCGSSRWQPDSQLKVDGLVWGSVTAVCWSAFVKLTGWTLAMVTVIIRAP